MSKKSINKQIFQEAFDLMNSERNEIFLNDLEHKIGEAVLKTNGVEQAVVTSAVSFNDKEKSLLVSQLFKILKREVQILFKTDPKVLGGFKIIMGDWILDGTMVCQINQMKKVLGGN